jgi:hypothetical protein
MALGIDHAEALLEIRKTHLLQRTEKLPCCRIEALYGQGRSRRQALGVAPTSSEKRRPRGLLFLGDYQANAVWREAWCPQHSFRSPIYYLFKSRYPSAKLAPKIEKTAKINKTIASARRDAMDGEWPWQVSWLHKRSIPRKLSSE